MASDSDRPRPPHHGVPPAPDDPAPPAAGHPGALDEADARPDELEVVGFAPVGPDGVPIPIYAASDRPRGLDAYFAPGGEDAASPDRRAEERRMIRLLVLMVALLVGIPTALTLIAFAGQLLSLRSGG